MSSNIRVNSITPSVGNSVAIGTAGGSVTFNNAAVVDVDGHTELDNVNISGVVTATSFAGPLTGNVTGTAGGLSGSPSITVTDITSSGNVSIAGTLTYEDVTNIDSVGLVTARDGIIVTGGSVGIGTTNPSVIFHSYHPTINTVGKFESGDASVNIRFRDGDTTNEMGIGALGNDFIVTAASGGERVRVTSAGSIGISSTAPKTDVDISQKTGAVALPQGTTAQRPTGSAPYIRKNTTNNALEYFDGTSWVEIITDYFPTGSVILG